MRVARSVAFVFTVLCLAAAAVTMLSSTTFTAGSSSTVDCGSAAYPKSLSDFESTDDAANCAGQTSASPALYLVLLAGVGFGIFAATSRSGVLAQDTSRASAHKPSDSSASV
jgi:hypothetical protein